jgi:hypothetical protein
VFTYGLVGTKGFFLNGIEDVRVLGLWFFMMVFMDTTATIPTGTMAERSFCENRSRLNAGRQNGLNVSASNEQFLARIDRHLRR